MGFKFVEKLWERNEICKQQSDTDFYMSLLYTGEAVIKISTLALVAGVSEDLNRARYQQLYRIVRADGIGEWASILYSLTQGATYEYITQDLRPDIQELTQKVNEGDWRHEAIKYLNDALTIVMPEVPAINKKVNFRSWYELFAQFRNKTRGHGVISGTDTTSICPLLAHSLHLVCSNLSIFKREWAYAEKSLSNKPVIIALSGESERLRVALSAPNLNLSDGVDIFAD
jgi:hypothetical protein